MPRVLSRSQRDAVHASVDRITSLPEDPPLPSSGGQDAVTALTSAITARPWRRSAVDSATLADIQRKVADAVETDSPLEFSVPFGGYKSWRLLSFPHLDWAELFWIDYLRRYAERLAALHAPGVVLSFTYLRGVLGWVNNLRQSDQDAYLAELMELMRLRSSPRVMLRCIDLTEFYGGPDATLALLAKRALQAPDPTSAQMASANRNFVRTGGERDLSALSELQWQAAVHQAAKRCGLMEGLEARRAYNKFGPRIQLTHIRGPSLALHLGSCRSEVAQPWVSTGYLEWREAESDWLERLASGPFPPNRACAMQLRHALADLSPCLSSLSLVLDSGP